MLFSSWRKQRVNSELRTGRTEETVCETATRITWPTVSSKVDQMVVFLRQRRSGTLGGYYVAIFIQAKWNPPRSIAHSRIFITYSSRVIRIINRGIQLTLTLTLRGFFCLQAGTRHNVQFDFKAEYYFLFRNSTLTNSQVGSQSRDIFWVPMLSWENAHSCASAFS